MILCWISRFSFRRRSISDLVEGTTLGFCFMLLYDIWTLESTLGSEKLMASFEAISSSFPSSPDFLLILCRRSILPSWKYLCLKMGIYFSFRILWKSYMLSWRTKEENLLCLKYLGSIYFINFSLSLTMKQLPSSVHSTMLLFRLS